MASLDILDKPPERELDSIVRVAQKLLGCKIALVDDERFSNNPLVAGRRITAFTPAFRFTPKTRWRAPGRIRWAHYVLRVIGR